MIDNSGTSYLYNTYVHTHHTHDLYIIFISYYFTLVSFSFPLNFPCFLRIRLCTRMIWCLLRVEIDLLKDGYVGGIYGWNDGSKVRHIYLFIILFSLLFLMVFSFNYFFIISLFIHYYTYHYFIILYLILIYCLFYDLFSYSFYYLFYYLFHY